MTGKHSSLLGLRRLLVKLKGSHLYHHWQLGYVLQETDDALMYDAFQDAVPVQDYTGFINTLRAVGGLPRAHDAEVLSQPHMLLKRGIPHIVSGDQRLFPATGSFLKNCYFVEKMILAGDVPGIGKFSGKLCHIFEKGHIDAEAGVTVADFRTAQMQQLPWAVGRRLVPHLSELAPVGRSNYQRLHAFLDALEKHGRDVAVLMVRPQVLNDMALFLAQRQGGQASFKALCPNLKVIVHYGERLAPYRKNLEQFLAGLKPKYLKLIREPYGLVALQSDGDRRGALTLYDDLGVFYEFVPEEDVRPDGSLSRHYQRLHAGEVVAGHDYALVVSNQCGLLGYNTGVIITVVQTDPLRITFKRMAETLDLFGERISLDILEDLIFRANNYLANHQFHIREYMIGDDVEANAVRWVFELSRTLDGIADDYLQSVTNMLHNEMRLRNRYYREAIASGQMPLPQVTFLPLGTISTMEMDGALDHMDLTEDAARVNRILGHARDQRTFLPKTI